MQLLAVEDCELRTVPSDVARTFLEDHHREGAIGAKIVSCGLYWHNELVGLIAFCAPIEPSLRERYSQELVSVCFKSELQVRGGVSALFSFYVESFNPSDVFAYPSTVEGFFSADTELAKTLAHSTENSLHSSVYEWLHPSRTHYVYRITAADSKKYYYGVSHVKKAQATEDDCLADGYWGSGGTTSNLNKFRSWRAKHQDFLQKEVLATFSRKSEAYQAERLFIGELYRTDKLCLNSVAGGRDGGLNGWRSGSNLQTRNCATHGAAIFIGNRCRKCITAASIIEKLCFKHGESLHHGESCMRCTAENRVSVRSCEAHGETKFQGDSCYKCLMSTRGSMRSCEVHGLARFSGDSCIRCYTAPKEKLCEVHGLAPHSGSLCMSCKNSGLNSVQLCDTHGETTFKGDSCYRCWGEKSVTFGYCEEHGETKFRKDSCCKCKFKSKVKIELCEVHGESKHLNGVCYKCRGESSSHNKNHQDSKNANCRICKEDTRETFHYGKI